MNIGDSYEWNDTRGIWEEVSNGQGTHEVKEILPCSNPDYDCCDFVILTDRETGSEEIRVNTEMLGSKEEPEEKPAKPPMEGMVFRVVLSRDEEMLMFLPPGTGNYLGYTLNDKQQFIWWDCPAWKDGSPDKENLGIIEEWGVDIDTRKRLQDFVIKATRSICFIWGGGW